MLKRYPWYSVDSSSWVQAALNGGVYILPQGRVFGFSDTSPSRKRANQHIDNIPDIEREAIEERLRKMGADPERLRTEYVARWSYNLRAFYTMGMEALTTVRTFKAAQPSLF
jgi:hypothetical protein